MIKWGDAQKDAIDYEYKHNNNIIVSASAGAGKTAVLVERLIHRIIDGKTSLDRVLATTFTEASASDIKNKLNKKLNEKILASTDDQEKEKLLNQLALLADSDISTLHSVCLKIIQKYYYVIGLDANVTNNVLDDNKTIYYQNIAISNTLEKAYQAKRPAFINLLDKQSPKILSNNDLIKAIKDLAEAALTHLDYKKWLNDSISVYRHYDNYKDLDETIKSYYSQYLLDLTTEYYQKLITALDSNIYEDSINEKVECCRKALEYLKNDDYQNYRQYLIASANIKCSKPRNTSYLNDAETIFQKQIIEKLFPEEILLKDIEECKPLAYELVLLTKDYINEFNKIKNDIKAITFDDMEIYALDIIKANDYEIAKVLRNHYTDIFVDEFQDTSEIQNEIVTLISNGHNVFRVGDIKQSIYRFRYAKPQLMQNLLENKDKTNDVIRLTDNYRSSNSIVDMSNRIFKLLLNIKDRPQYFSDEDIVNCGNEELKDYHDPIRLVLLNNKSNLKYKNDLRKSLFIAQDIQRMMKNDNSLKYKHFAILVSSNSHKLVIKKALDYYNIPSFGAIDNEFYKCDSVNDILAYLRYLYDPTDTISLYTILKSFYSYSDDQLVEVNKKSLSNADPQLYQEINDLRNQNKYLLLKDIINTILSINNFYEAKNDDYQRANIDLLLEYVDLFSKNSQNIESFLNFIELSNNDKVSQASLSNNEADAVTIMTIHKSKGLEFPIVYLFSKNMDKSRNSDYVYVNNQLGFGLKTISTDKRFVRNNIIYQALSYMDNIEESEEEARLLYVAITRAKKQMIVVDVYNNDEDKIPDENDFDINYLTKNKFTSWLYKSLNMIGTNSHSRIEIVEEVEEIPNISKTINTNITYHERYKLNSQNIDYLSPSQTEINNLDYSLDFDSYHQANNIGTDIHGIFEKLPNKIWTNDEIKKALGNYSRYQVSFESFNNSQIYQEILKGEIKKELPFYVNDNNKIIHGYIDLCSILDNEIILVDFKTDRKVNDDILIERYKDQISLYIRALNLIYPNKKVRAYLYSLTLNCFISIN